MQVEALQQEVERLRKSLAILRLAVVGSFCLLLIMSVGIWRELGTNRFHQGIRVSAQPGFPGTLMTLNEHGPLVLLSDAKGATRAILEVDKTNVARLALLDPSGKIRIELRAAESGGNVCLYSASGQSVAQELLYKVEPAHPGKAEIDIGVGSENEGT